MEPLLETIDLDYEESNELIFKVKIEGAEPTPAKVRLVCETPGDMMYMFRGQPTGEDGVVKFTIPPMKGKVKEGEVLSRIEVLIENRYFAPVQFGINFKQTMRVVAEAVKLAPRKPAEIKVSATPVVAPKAPSPPPPQPVQKPAIIQSEAPQQRQSPPPVRVNAGVTLKERLAAREEQEKLREEAVRKQVEQKKPTPPQPVQPRPQPKKPPVVEADESMIRRLAREFIRGSSPRKK
jgi:hypothetical protein